MSESIARKAVQFWGLGGRPLELVARRENTVYRVTDGPDSYALRLHRMGYRTRAELTSELEWMGVLARGGLSVPAPLKTTSHALSVEVEGVLVDLLCWASGAPLGKAGQLQGIENRLEFCRMLGAQMAVLHRLSDEWKRPGSFTRPSWDRAGLLGEHPLWGRFWDHPHLSAEDRALLITVRERADAALARVETQLDYGLIHADLLSENMLWDGTRLTFIDFDDGGFGFRDFELATFLMRYLDAPDYPELQAALLDGYRVRRRVDPDNLRLFILLRALTYPGWIIDRLGEPGAGVRSERALDTALKLARDYMDKEER
ncbi:MAG: homoserine kinase [Rhodobacterales bacterium]|nr:MAG: homoserine kinase [Rhodobacterales bacterium]